MSGCYVKKEIGRRERRKGKESVAYRVGIRIRNPHKQLTLELYSSRGWGCILEEIGRGERRKGKEYLVY
jgi:hypothetical protein